MQVTDDIYESGDGYLFLTGGHHEVAAYMLGTKQPSAASRSTFVENQRQRADWCAAQGIAYDMWVFPDKLYVLRDKVPELGDLRSLFLHRYRADPGWIPDLPVQYPAERLERQPRFMTIGDTHYSPRGEIELTSLILERLEPGQGEAFRREAGAALTGQSSYLGDLGRKLAEPRRETLKVLEAPLVRFTQVKNGVPGNTGTLILIDSPEARSDRTLLIFGDSFFRVMLHHLAWGFRRIVFCRTQYFHQEIARSLRPQVILGGMAERYLAECLPDGARPHFLSYALLAGREMKPEPGFAELFAGFFDQRALL